MANGLEEEVTGDSFWVERGIGCVLLSMGECQRGQERVG